MGMKKFAIILDHKSKTIIHGESGPAEKIVHCIGLEMAEYETLDGYNSDMDKMQAAHP